MDLKPLDDRIILRKKERPEVTAGGLILPDIAKIESMEGVVVAVGPGKFDEDNNRIPPVVIQRSHHFRGPPLRPKPLAALQAVSP